MAQRPTMSTFADFAARQIAAAGPSNARQRLWDAYVATGLPTTADEVWRYAPLSSLDMDGFADLTPSDDSALEADVMSLTDGAATVLIVRDGTLVSSSKSVMGVEISTQGVGAADNAAEYSTRYAADAFALLCGALSPACLVIKVATGTVVAGPIIIVHQISVRAAFPNMRIMVGAGARAEIVECLVGGADALVAPVAEFHVANDATLRLATYQRLATSAWHIARTTAILSRGARMHQSIVGLGAHYNRSRNDAEFDGPGAENELHTTFLGAGDQVHDFRTHQFHRAPRTTSQLLSKGAVADEARSIYTGLIEIEKGAKRTDARQTNLNLLLSPNAHADTVPNLDIRENDVMCAHASSVGPLDELQRWYLESRGVDPDRAERLLVMGFFNEMTDQMPATIATMVEGDVARVLGAVRQVSA